MIFEPIIRAGGIFTILYFGSLIGIIYFGYLTYKKKGLGTIIGTLVPVIIMCFMFHILASELIGKSKFDTPLTFITTYIFYLIPIFAGTVFSHYAIQVQQDAIKRTKEK